MASPPLISPPPLTNSSLSPPPENLTLSPPPLPSSIAPIPSSPPPPPTSSSPQPPPSADPPSPPLPLPSSPPPNNQPPPANASPPPPEQSSPSPPNNSPPPQLPNPISPPPPAASLPPQTSASPPPPSLPTPNSPIVPVPSGSPRPSNSSPGLSPPPIVRTSPPPPPTMIVSPPSRTTPPSRTLVPPGSVGRNDSVNSSPEYSRTSNGGGIGTGATIGIALVLGLVLLGILGTVACCMWRRKKKAQRRSSGLVSPAALISSPELSDFDSRKVQILSSSSSYNRLNSSNDNAYTPRTPGGGLRNSRSWFIYEELVEATNGFSTQNLLGEGGFGSVYKGNLGDGRVVAVKKLKTGGGEGEREFRSEVEIISRIHHRHLVSLVGYCIYEDGRILVYDYVPNNNLYYHLHGDERNGLDWVTRVKVALGAARGIAYLHEDCHPRIIHRDIKSSNILLDNKFEARVSDFGLAKLAVDANTHVTTRVMGTFGYMAPEYASSGKLTEKSDVYSFGVVLLELITGRKPVDTSRPIGEESLVEWARPLLNNALESHEFKTLADPRLEGNYVEGEMFRIIEAAAACVRHSSAKRPKMGQVVRALDGMSTADLSNGMKVGESDVFDQAESAQVRVFQKMVLGNGDFSTDFFIQENCSEEENAASSK